MYPTPKAQVAIEFVLLTGLALMISIAFSIAALDEINDIRLKQQYQAVTDIARLVDRELSLANYVEVGYDRTFVLPPYASNKNYTVEFAGTTVVVSTELTSATRPSINVTGTLRPGPNRVTKTEQGVFLNP